MSEENNIDPVENPTENQEQQETQETPTQETPTQETPETPAQTDPQTDPQEETQEQTQETQENPEQNPGETQQTENTVREGIYPKKIYLTQEQCTQKALDALALNRQVAAKKLARAQYVDEFDNRLKQMDAEIKQLEEEAGATGNIALNGEMIEEIPVDIHTIGNEEIYVKRGQDITNPDNIVFRQTITE